MSKNSQLKIAQSSESGTPQAPGVTFVDSQKKDDTPSSDGVVFLNAPGKTRRERFQKKVDDEKSNNFLENINWKQLGMMLGGGLLAHSLASSLVNNKTEEEKRKETFWERMLRVTIPLGAMGLGGWGGKYLYSKVAADSFVLDGQEGQTNSLYDVHHKLPLAQKVVQDAAAGAGGAGPDLGPRMAWYLRDEGIPETKDKVDDASGNALASTIGAGVSGGLTGLSAWKWWDYARRNADYNAAQEVLKQHEPWRIYDAEKAIYDSPMAQRGRRGRWGATPTPPTPPTGTRPNPALVNKAVSTVSNSKIPMGYPSVKGVKLSPENLARAGVVVGLPTTAALTWAAIRNNNIAKEQSDTLEARKNLLELLDGLPDGENK